MKVLFVHNSLPEYRVAFWRNLSDLCTLDICITHPDLESTQYGFEFDKSGLNILEDSPVKICPIGYDVVVLPPADSLKDIVVSGVLIRKCHKAHVPTVFWTETWMPLKGTWSLKRRIKRFLKNLGQRHIARKANLCVVSGSKAREYLSNLGIGEGAIRTVIDSSALGDANMERVFEIRRSIPKSVKIILYFGRLSIWKGTNILAESFTRIRNERNDVFLLVCGDGECRESFEIVLRDSCPENSYRLLGKINPSERACYFAIANVFVLPSCESDGQIEIWGLSVNESLAAGVPVVATTAVGSAYDVLDEQVGMVVEQGDSDALANALTLVLRRNEDNNMATACKKRARTYSVENMARGFFNVFRELEKVSSSK